MFDCLQSQVDIIIFHNQFQGNLMMLLKFKNHISRAFNSYGY